MAAHKPFGLSKKEKIKSSKQLEFIFKKATYLYSPRLKIYYYFNPFTQLFPLQFGVGVGKKNFKKAVDRNRIKRLLREALRANKSILLNSLSTTTMQLSIFILYREKELPTLNVLEKEIVDSFEKITLKIAAYHNK